MSLMNGEASAVFTIVVACLALEATMKDQVEQLNTFGVTATALGILTKKPRRIGKCEIVCKDL